MKRREVSAEVGGRELMREAMGAMVGKFSGAWAPYDLNDVQRWGLGWMGLNGGDWGERRNLKLASVNTQRIVSWKALGALNSRWALPVYAVSEDEKSNMSNEKSFK